MAILSTILAETLGKYVIKQTFEEGLTRDLSDGVFGWALKRLGREKAPTLERHCNDLAANMLGDVEAFLEREGASRDQIGRLGRVLAGALEQAEPSRLVTENAYDEEAVAAALVAATPDGRLDASEAGLYETMTGMIAAQLVKLGPALHDYAPKSEAAKFRALAALARDTGTIKGDVASIRETLASVERSIGDKAHEITRRRNLFIEEYRSAIRRELDYVEILGLDRVDREQISAKLSLAYLSLTGRTGKIATHFDLLLAVLLVRGQRIIIEGGAGSGKSTLLRWAASEGPARRHSQPIKKWPEKSTVLTEPSVEVELVSGDRLQVFRGFDPTSSFYVIPYLVRLRSLDNATLPDIENFPREISSALRRPPPNFVADTLREGHAILMFDGVDEVPEGAPRERVLREIGQYAKAYPKCPIIIATRPNAFDPKAVDGLEDFERYVIDDLSPTQQALFIDRWHEARADVAGPDSRTDFAAIAEQLKERFRLSPQLSRMAGSPLLCAAICALHERQPETLPENERDLVEALTLMLLRRDIIGGRTRAIDIKSFGPEYALDDNKRLALLGHLAAKMVRAGLSQLDHPAALQQMPRALTEIGEPDLDPERMLAALVARSGVLRACSRAGEEGGLDAVEFIHNRFKEWLASVFFVGEDDWEELSRNADREDFAEVCVFAAAAPGNKKFAGLLIETLLERAESGKGEARRTFEILAFRASMAATALNEELRGRTDRLRRKLLPPKNVTEAKALAQAGDDIVARLKQTKRKRSGTISVACIRCLGLIGTPKAKAAMASYLDDTRMGVVRELVRHLPPHEVPGLWRGKDGALEIETEFAGRLSRLPDNFPEPLTHLDLRNSRIVDISGIGALPDLDYLCLEDTQVVDLSPLAGLTKLKTLDLSGLSEDALATLPALPSLTSLTLERISDVAGVPFDGFPELRSLSLGESGIEDLGAVADLGRLEVLELWGTKVRDIGALDRLSVLRQLNLSRSAVTDISVLASLRSLETLYLTGLGVDVAPLADLQELRYLFLANLPEQSLQPLAGLHRLQRLAIDGTPVDGLSWIAGLESLTELSASKTGVSSGDLELLPLSLRRLDIAGNPVGDLSALCRLTRLETLTLTDTSVRDLSSLLELPKLRVLSCDQQDAYRDTPVDVIRALRTKIERIFWDG